MTAEAPKDRPILAYGILGFEAEPCWGVVRWARDRWQLTPTEATEYEPESCAIWGWQDLPDALEKPAQFGAQSAQFGRGS